MEVNIENLMKTAVAEMNNGQYDEAAKHFDMVVIYDPENIEAPLFRAHCNCYGGTLGDMPNFAIKFTNAFCRYVDDVQELDDPITKKKKIADAYQLLSKQCNHYIYNVNQHPTVTSTLSSTKDMYYTCVEKLKSEDIELSDEILENMSEIEKSISPNAASNILTFIGLLLIGGAVFAFFYFAARFFF